MKIIKLLIAVAVLVPLLFYVLWEFTLVHGDGDRTFTLRLTPATQTSLKMLRYDSYTSSAHAQSMAEFYRGKRALGGSEEIVVQSDGTFHVTVRTWFTERLWGLYRKSGMSNHILLIALFKDGRRTYNLITVESDREEPIDLLNNQLEPAR